MIKNSSWKLPFQSENEENTFRTWENLCFFQSLKPWNQRCSHYATSTESSLVAPFHGIHGPYKVVVVSRHKWDERTLYKLGSFTLRKYPSIFGHSPSLKLTYHLKMGRNPKGNDRIPTVHFQVRAVSFRECIWPKTHFTPLFSLQPDTLVTVEIQATRDLPRVRTLPWFF